MFEKSSFESHNLSSTEKENHFEENNFSEELKLKLEEFKGKLQDFGGETEELIAALAEARIPHNRHDKESAGNLEADYLEDIGFIKKFDNLTVYLDNINSDETDSVSLLKKYNDIKEEIKYIHDRFNDSGYLSDKGQGGDVLKNDFPELATKVNGLMAKIPELDRMTVSLNNRLYAQEIFKDMDSKGASYWGEYISKIRYISKNGQLGFNSLEIGKFRTPEELVENLEKFLDNDLKDSVNKVQESENFDDKEKAERIEALQGLIAGGREYLDELKKLI